MKKTITLLAGLIVWSFVNNVFAVNFVEIKGGESPSEMDRRIPHRSSLHGDVVVHTRNGRPHLPDLEKWKKREVANELSFTFESSEYPWTDQEMVTLKQVIADFYPVIKKIYGNPAFSITVNIRKNPTITSEGLYYPSDNQLVIRNLNTIDPIVHEMIHAFHDDLAIGSQAYEEGMTRATEVAAFNELPQYRPYFDQNHSYGIDVYYDLNNEPSISSKYGSFFMGFPNPLMKYQQAGYAWGKMLIEDNTFLAKFNSKYYSLGYIDPSISGSTTKLKGIVKKIMHRVENEPFNTWYNRQNIFNENPDAGYQTLYKGDSGVLYVFNRDLNGFEQPLQGVIVSWEIYSCDGTNLLNGIDVTSELGWIGFPLSDLWPQYQGKVRIEANISLPDLVIKRQISATTAPQAGIFGITDECTGEIDFVRVNSDRINIVRNVTIENGAFSIPELASMPGKFTIIKRGGAKRTITKDANNYFVIF